MIGAQRNDAARSNLKGGANLKNPAKREYLPDAIEKTRRARMEAERRLLFCDRLGKVANAAFACWTTVFALLAFAFPNSQWIAFVTVGSSVTLAIVSFCTSAQNYGVRAAQMKVNYIGLHRLWLELDNADVVNNPDERADRIGERYLDLLSCSENHSEGDYLRSRKDNKEQASNASSEVADFDKLDTNGEEAKVGEVSRSDKTDKAKDRGRGLCERATHFAAYLLIGVSPLALAISLKFLYQYVDCLV